MLLALLLMVLLAPVTELTRLTLITSLKRRTGKLTVKGYVETAALSHQDMWLQTSINKSKWLRETIQLDGLFLYIFNKKLLARQTKCLFISIKIANVKQNMLIENGKVPLLTKLYKNAIILVIQLSLGCISNEGSLTKK